MSEPAVESGRPRPQSPGVSPGDQDRKFLADVTFCVPGETPALRVETSTVPVGC
jgi:hypothetical protein